MAKVIALLTDGQYDEARGKIRIQTAVIVKPTAGETFMGFRMDSNIYVDGTEGLIALNGAVNDQIRADVLAAVGVSPSNADIKVTKFT